MTDAELNKLIKNNPGPVGNVLACLHHNLQQAQTELAEQRVEIVRLNLQLERRTA